MVDGDVMRLQRKRRDELLAEADADEDRPGALGQEPVVIPTPASHSVAIAGEGDAGDDDEIERGGGNERRPLGQWLKQPPAGGAKRGEVRYVVKAKLVALDSRVTGCTGWERLPEDVDVGLRWQRREEADAAGVAPLTACGHRFAKEARPTGTLPGRDGGEPGADEGAEFRLGGHDKRESARKAAGFGNFLSQRQ